MSGEEFVLSIIAIVMGSSVVIVGITKISGLIKSWINRNSSNLNEETFDRLAKAFMQHKRDTERRLQKLEAMITDKKASKDQSGSSHKSKEIDAPQKSIEIEDHETEKVKSEKDASNLRNMLRE